MKKAMLSLLAIALLAAAAPTTASADDITQLPTGILQEECEPTICPEDDTEPLSSRNLFISEVAARICPNNAASCTSDEGKPAAFIEVFNAGTMDFTMVGWKLYYATATAGNGFAVGNKTLLAEVMPPIEPRDYMALDGAVGNATNGYVILEDENGEVVDIVGYGSAVDAATNLTPRTNWSMQRCELDDEAFDGFALYEVPTRGSGLPCFDEVIDPPIEEPPIDEPAPNLCDGLILNEIGANLDQQFIEVKNIGNAPLNPVGCRIMTNRSDTKFFAFPDGEIATDGFGAVIIADTDLTLTKTAAGTVYLLSSDGLVEIDGVDYANLDTDTSFARFDDGWRQSFVVTMGAANVFQEFEACPDGFFRNEETGRCNKIVVESEPKLCDDGFFLNEATNRCNKNPSANALVPCAANQFRNPETNRCNNLTTAANSLVPCTANQERNPATNRCRAIAMDDELTPCAAGQERNPDTNRCRTVAAADAADFPVETVAEAAANTNPSWPWIVGGVGMFATGLLLWQFRSDIGRVVKKGVKK